MAKSKKFTGKNIPMSDFQREFLETHGKYVDNPTMELAMVSKDKYFRSNKSKMKFGNGYLPWLEQISESEMKALRTAENKKFICKNPECAMNSKEVNVQYKLEIHVKNLRHSNIPDVNKISFKRFGKRTHMTRHVAIVCRHCGKRIKFVKATKTNRRAAKDPYISGPHQKGTGYVYSRSD